MKKYQYKLRNIPEERISHLHRDGSLKSRTFLLYFEFVRF
jgi:hypothetical protein